MPITIEAPNETHMQRSGKDSSGQSILSVLAKRTYRIDAQGNLLLSEEQAPLTLEPAADEATGRLLTDIDLFDFKPLTDLVILGHTYGRGRSEFMLNIGVNDKVVKKIRVVGDREVVAAGANEILILPPNPVDKVPLSYTHAYGGVDEAAFKKHGNPWSVWNKYFDPEEMDLNQLNPYRYPRNPAGRGYLMEPTVDAINALQLPNLEDPLDPLTPQRLIVKQPGWWYKQPLPQATEWLSYGWFPRIAYTTYHQGTLEEPKTFVEAERGFCPKNLLLKERPPVVEDAFRFIQGASLGLQLPLFKGGERIAIDNVLPTDNRLQIRLPDKPKIWVDGRKGTLKDTEPVIHTVVVEPDLKRVSIVWRGSALALRPYAPDELKKMPFKVIWG